MSQESKQCGGGEAETMDYLRDIQKKGVIRLGDCRELSRRSYSAVSCVWLCSTKNVLLSCSVVSKAVRLLSTNAR